MLALRELRDNETYTRDSSVGRTLPFTIDAASHDWERGYPTKGAGATSRNSGPRP